MADATGAILEAALVDDPGDVAAHAAYADWLMQQGDPRGEFIQVQFALEDQSRGPAERAELERREAELLQAHARSWLGALGDQLPTQEEMRAYSARPPYTFRRGWLHALTLPTLDRPIAAALASAPETRLLQELTIFSGMNQESGVLPPDDFELAEHEYVGVGPLLGSPHLRNLRVLQLGPSRHEEPGVMGEFLYNFGPDHFGRITPFVRTLPHLRELYLDGAVERPEELFALDTLTELRVLAYCYGNEYPLQAIANNPALKRLHTLVLHPQGLSAPGPAYLTLDAIRALLYSPHFPQLTHLRLHMTDAGDRLCEEIVRSGILKRLKVLDLSWGAITDAGAQTLAACPDLRNLDHLILENNALRSRGIKRLQAAGVQFVADPNSQHRADDDSYLFEGDME
jgi:uncharacterized protein (TIGR02996 family)